MTSISKVITFSLFSIILFSCTDITETDTQSHSHDKLSKVKIGLALQPAGSLFFIAQEQGFFKKHNLEVIMTNYPSGKRALNDGLLTGKEDIITTAEVPFVFSSFKQKELRVISSLFVSDNVNSIVARRDAGISKPEDLKEKHIATQKSSAVDYFLNLFLLENNMRDDEMEVSYMKAEKLPSALAQAKIDAFSMREPYIEQAKNKLGSNAIIFKEPGLYNQVELLISNESYLKNNSLVVEKLLEGLLEAKEFARDHALEANKIVAKSFDVDLQVAANLMKNMRPKIVLDQSMLFLIEGIGRWAIDKKLVDAAELPDYLEYFHCSALQSVNEKLVTVIH